MQMSLPPKEGDCLLYMKVGNHARETLEAIIARKTKEIQDAGFAMWGYGGNTCHPLTMVQPFAKDYVKRNGTIYLCMQPMSSKHFAEQVRANEFSVDGTRWKPIPSSINVMGSRYALLIKDLRQEAFDLELSRTKVAIGNSRGRIGSKYVTGRVDKACLEITAEEAPKPGEKAIARIELVAEMLDPFAVFVRTSSKG